MKRLDRVLLLLTALHLGFTYSTTELHFYMYILNGKLKPLNLTETAL